MPNGKPDDHPLTDILVHKRSVFSSRIDKTIREIDQLGGRHEILDRIVWFPRPPLPELERALLDSLDRLRQLRREQGWEDPGA
jgi:hypothetical protein